MEKLKIVVIDDEECIRESLAWFLEDLGHEVHTAASPQVCRVYHGHDCDKGEACADALLIDHNMPGMNGLDFIVMLKERGCRGVTANMLLMSGDIASVNTQKALELGCEVVQKPLSFSQLGAWVDKVVQRIGTRQPPHDKGPAEPCAQRSENQQ